jgi:hypothetical protein
MLRLVGRVIRTMTAKVPEVADRTRTTVRRLAVVRPSSTRRLAGKVIRTGK